MTTKRCADWLGLFHVEPFKNSFNELSYDNHNLPFFLSRVISIPKICLAGLRSFISKDLANSSLIDLCFVLANYHHIFYI